jgi:putative transposase
VRAIQVDGGSEFYGEFEGPRKEYGIKLFVLPPRSPISVEWWNGSIGPSGRVLGHFEEEVDLDTMNFHLERWTEKVYNRKRPHWSLRGRGEPWEYLRDTGLVECPT